MANRRSALVLGLVLAPSACGDSGPGGSGGDGGATGNVTTGSVTSKTVGVGTTTMGAGGLGLVVNGSGFEKHNGRPVYAKVLRQANSSEVAVAKSAFVLGGNFSLMLDGGLESNGAYFLNYYVEANGMDGCQLQGDEMWSESFVTQSSDVVIPITYSPNFAFAACDAF